MCMLTSIVIATATSAILGLSLFGRGHVVDETNARTTEQVFQADSNGDSDRGKLLFKQLNCATCHSTNGDNGLGPTMKGYFGSEVQYADGSSAWVDEALAREGIISPAKKLMAGYGPTMPAVDYAKSPRTLADVDDLVAYLRSMD